MYVNMIVCHQFGMVQPLVSYFVIEYQLQHGADVNRRNRDNLTPLDMVKGHDSDIADLLRGDDALLDASKKGDLDRVKKLVTPENINCRDEHGRNSTPLHLAGNHCLDYNRKSLI